MRPLHLLDLVFLSLEKKQQPMHVGGLFLFDEPNENIQTIIQKIKTSQVPPVSPFNYYLKGFSWKENLYFSPLDHFQHLHLEDASLQDVENYISHQHSIALNRKKPLWSCTLISGLKNNRFALYIKIHHAVVDGVAAMRIIEKSFSSQPECQEFMLPWVTHKVKKEAKKNQIIHQKSTSKIYNELKQAIFHDRKYSPDYVTSTQAPACILNQKITSNRLFTAKSFSLSKIKKIADKLDITLNDTILALCSGALRHYLERKNQLPSKPLIAMVPASVRDENDHDLSNRITMILANLATNIIDPIERANKISRSTAHAKLRFKRMTQKQIFGYSACVYAPAGLNILMGFRPKKQAFNIVISNVPGSKIPLYWNGAKLNSIYPASVVFDGQALNITFTSYLDKLEIGLIACRDILPDIDLLLSDLTSEIQLYEKL